jgi:hypothetical protein
MGLDNKIMPLSKEEGHYYVLADLCAAPVETFRFLAGVARGERVMFYSLIYLPV